MNYNCIYFHLKKLPLGPIDAALQKLKYALKNSARANFFFSPPNEQCIFDKPMFDACFLVQIVELDQAHHLLPFLGSVRKKLKIL